MLVVLSILTILAVLALPVAELTEMRSREKKLWQNLSEMRAGLDRYRAAHISSYPPSIASLLEPIPSGFLKPAANAGPFLATEAIMNPFAGGNETYLSASQAFLWDIRDGDIASDADDDWTLGVQNVDAQFGPQGGVVDVRFPTNGVSGWKSGIDGSRYDQW